MARKTVILHSEWDCFLNRLNNEELGQWLRSVLRLMETDEEPQNLSRPVEMAFYAAYERIQRDWESFDRRSRNLRQNTPKPPQKKSPKKPAPAAQTPSCPQPAEPDPENPRQTAAAPKKAPAGFSPAENAAQNPAGQKDSADFTQDPAALKNRLESPGPVLAPAERSAGQNAANSADIPPKGPESLAALPAPSAKAAFSAGQPQAPAPDAELLALYSSHFGPPGPFASAGLFSAQQQLGLALTRAIVEKAIANGARQWAYLQTSFDAARRQGLHSVEDYRLSRLRATGQIVDRSAPSKTDFLTRAVRPLAARLNRC